MFKNYTFDFVTVQYILINHISQFLELFLLFVNFNSVSSTKGMQMALEMSLPCCTLEP